MKTASIILIDACMIFSLMTSAKAQFDTFDYTKPSRGRWRNCISTTLPFSCSMIPSRLATSSSMQDDELVLALPRNVL